MKPKTILYFPVLNWSFLKQRPQQILSQFARNGWTVYFCNNTQTGDSTEEVEPNLFVVHNFENLMKDIKHGKIKIDVAYATWAKSAEYFDRVNAKINIYDSIDEFPDWAPFEEYAVNSADIVLTSSQRLFDIRSVMHDNVHLVRNAAPSEYIDRESTRPVEYEDINGPIVAFVGALGSWTSTYLIKKVAEKYPTVFVGLEFGKQCPSNVINLGCKNHDELYDYYAHADVCLIPFNTKTNITQSASPVKMYEHLAAGTITVATKWHETDLYPSAVLTADNDEEFLAKVDEAIVKSKVEGFKEKAKLIASDNTWEVRFAQIEKAIEEYTLKSGVVIGS
ncbi:glycosyltransferase family protein [Paenibacillus sp. QZ-Y1]|uniref:glycosyltransferase family protein n=1 Tax=Paenibacillus sp. QZ-Y1 TaxID=3414511 RepID=UPI003F7915B4